jgi:hypothetical protein
MPRAELGREEEGGKEEHSAGAKGNINVKTVPEKMSSCNPVIDPILS